MSKALATLALAFAAAVLGVAWAAPEETRAVPLSPDVVPQKRAEVWSPAAPANPLPRAWQGTRKAVSVQHMYRTAPSL